MRQHPFNAEDEVMAEVKREAPCFEMSKNELGYSEGKSCTGQRLRGPHHLAPSLTCAAIDTSHCSFRKMETRKGLKVLLLQMYYLSFESIIGQATTTRERIYKKRINTYKKY